MTRLSPDDLALKATTRALTDACGGSEACAVVLDKSASLIRSYGNPNVLDRFMPANDILALERLAGRPIVSAWGVERHKSDPDRPRRPLTLPDLQKLVKECAETQGEWIEAAADGRFCAADRLKLGCGLRELAALCLEQADALDASE